MNIFNDNNDNDDRNSNKRSQAKERKRKIKEQLMSFRAEKEVFSLSLAAVDMLPIQTSIAKTIQSFLDDTEKECRDLPFLPLSMSFMRRSCLLVLIYLPAIPSGTIQTETGEISEGKRQREDLLSFHTTRIVPSKMKINIFSAFAWNACIQRCRIESTLPLRNEFSSWPCTSITSDLFQSIYSKLRYA